MIPFSISDKNVWLDGWTKYNYGPHLVIILINMAFYGKHHLDQATKDCNIEPEIEKKLHGVHPRDGNRAFIQ